MTIDVVIPDELKHFLSSIQPGDKTRALFLRGAPGSGKSTLAREIITKYVNKGVVVRHLEADMYFVDDEGNYKWDARLLHEAHGWCFRSFAFDLVNGCNELVIVSNTFTRRKELTPYIEECTKHHREYAVYTCTGEYQNVHGVPEEKVKQMRKRIENNE